MESCAKILKMEEAKSCYFCDANFQAEKIQTHISEVHFAGMRPQNVTHGIMEEFLENQGLCHIVRNISGFLDAQSMANCRLVCHSWKDLIDNERPWWNFQLYHISSNKKKCLFNGNDNKVEWKSYYIKIFPEVKAVTEEFSKRQSIPKLQEFVKEMWIYFRDDNAIMGPLGYAIYQSNVKFVQLLIDGGIDLATMISHYPMFHACRFGNLEIVQLLIKYFPSFDPTSRTEHGCTIFHMSALNQDVRVLKLILDSFRFEDSRETLHAMKMIHYAVLFGQKETIEFLLESKQKIGLNLEDRDGQGSTVLHMACANRDVEIVDLIFQELVKINSDIDLNSQNDYGYTPLHFACERRQLEIVKVLLENSKEREIDIDFNLVDGYGKNPLHIACMTRQLEIVKLLLDYSKDSNINFNVADDDGNTPLHIACKIGKLKIVKLLLDNSKEREIDIFKKNIDQETPWGIIKSWGHREISRMLLGQYFN